ncbi:MAG: NAD(+)/NADH kinase [Methanomicrobiales archaeon]|jgi:NAD+ kinase|nr:NAD(+)/NADH kinase [Methanomicrobiales archaeon]
MANILLVSKNVQSCENYMKALAEELQQLGHHVIFHENNRYDEGENSTCNEALFSPLFTKQTAPDYVVVGGGDGTVLLTVSRMPIQVPLVGINFGEVGFLADLSPGTASSFLHSFLEKTDPKINTRMRIRFDVNGTYVGTALNEAVIITDRPSKMLKIAVCIDGVRAEEFRADGLIVSTPTGSTAYAMSGGGPIVDPRLEVFIMVPMAPFILTNRPHLIQTERNVNIMLVEERPASLVIDGQSTITLTCDCTITIEKSPEPALFIDAGENFFEKVTRKLRHL